MEKNMLDTEKTDKVYLNFLETFYNEKLELFEKAEEPQKPKEADDEELKEHEKKVSLQLSNKVNPLKHSTFRVISQNSEDRSLGGNVTSIGTSSGGPTLYDFNKKHWKHIIPLLIYNILERADDDKFLDLESILKIRNSPMLRQFFFSRDVRNNPEAKNIKYYLDPRLFVIISKKIWFGLDKFLAEHSTVKKLFKTLVIKGKIDNVQKNVILGGTIIFTSYLKTCEEVYKMKKHGTTIVQIKEYLKKEFRAFDKMDELNKNFFDGLTIDANLIDDMCDIQEFTEDLERFATRATISVSHFKIFNSKDEVNLTKKQKKGEEGNVVENSLAHVKKVLMKYTTNRKQAYKKIQNAIDEMVASIHKSVRLFEEVMEIDHTKLHDIPMDKIVGVNVPPKNLATLRNGVFGRVRNRASLKKIASTIYHIIYGVKIEQTKKPQYDAMLNKVLTATEENPLPEQTDSFKALPQETKKLLEDALRKICHMQKDPKNHLQNQKTLIDDIVILEQKANIPELQSLFAVLTPDVKQSVEVIGKKAERVMALVNEVPIMSPATFKEKILPNLQNIGKRYNIKVIFSGGGRNKKVSDDKRESSHSKMAYPQVETESHIAFAIENGELKIVDTGSEVIRYTYNTLELQYNIKPSPIQFFPYYQKTSDSVWNRKAGISRADSPRRYLLLGLANEYFKAGTVEKVIKLKDEIKALSVESVNKKGESALIVPKQNEPACDKLMAQLEECYNRPDTGTLEVYTMEPKQFGRDRSIVHYLITPEEGNKLDKGFYNNWLVAQQIDEGLNIVKKICAERIKALSEITSNEEQNKKLYFSVLEFYTDHVAPKFFKVREYGSEKSTFEDMSPKLKVNYETFDSVIDEFLTIYLMYNELMNSPHTSEDEKQIKDSFVKTGSIQKSELKKLIDGIKTKNLDKEFDAITRNAPTVEGPNALRDSTALGLLQRLADPTKDPGDYKDILKVMHNIFSPTKNIFDIKALSSTELPKSGDENQIEI